jgi:hypothetical protein
VELLNTEKYSVDRGMENVRDFVGEIQHEYQSATSEVTSAGRTRSSYCAVTGSSSYLHGQATDGRKMMSF